MVIALVIAAGGAQPRAGAVECADGMAGEATRAGSRRPSGPVDAVGGRALLFRKLAKNLNELVRMWRIAELSVRTAGGTWRTTARPLERAAERGEDKPVERSRPTGKSMVSARRDRPLRPFL
jgi:hypothetical protein